MVDPVAWVFWIWVVLMVYAITLLIPERRDKTKCPKHTSTAYCACRKNLPPPKL